MKEDRNEHINKLFVDYKKSNDKNRLNEIFEYALPYAYKMAEKYSFLYNNDFNETYITAQEGLFFSIINYDMSLSNNFYRYTYNYIYIYLLRNRIEFSCFTNALLIMTILKSKNTIEKKYESKLNPTEEQYNLMLNDIIELTLKLYFINFPDNSNVDRKKINGNNIANILNIINYVQLDESMTIENCFYENYNFIEEIENNELSEYLEELLSKLNPREERIMRMLYGFNEFENKKTVIDAAKEFNVSHQRISQIKEKTLEKLGKPKIKAIIKNYL